VGARNGKVWGKRLDHNPQLGGADLGKKLSQDRKKAKDKPRGGEERRPGLTIKKGAPHGGGGTKKGKKDKDVKG